MYTKIQDALNAAKPRDVIRMCIGTYHEQVVIDKDLVIEAVRRATAIVVPYAANAVICDLAPPLSHQGMNLEAKQAWLDSWDGPIEIESRDLKITVSGDYAFCYGYRSMSGTPKAAGRPISFWMRATTSLRREGGTWKIVHEHDSVPFYMDGSLRPAFDLKP